MKFKIHRGTKEIGGSCVEVWTENTRILLDFGMPLVEKDGREFDFGKFKGLNHKELIGHGVLPDIKGLYNESAVIGCGFAAPGRQTPKMPDMVAKGRTRALDSVTS